MKASLLVTLRIAKCGKTHPIVEEQSKDEPTAKDMAICMLDESSANQLDTRPLSNDTLHCRIESMLLDFLVGIQLDKSTNISNYAPLK